MKPFWSRVTKSDDCWVWTGPHTERGYGLICEYPHRGRKAHVVAWEEANGPVPSGLVLDHLCFTRDCVRPSHLEPVTHAENAHRMAVRYHPHLGADVSDAIVIR